MSSPAQYEKLGRSWERAELVRNPDYWNPARRPKVDRLVLVCAPEVVTRSNALLTGQLDLIETPAPDMLPQLRQAGAHIV